MKFEYAADAIQSVVDELTLLCIIFVKEVNENLQTTTSGPESGYCSRLFSVITYEINICSVRTDEWHSKRMKFEASKRHSGECFFEVNSMITGIPLSLSSVWHIVVEMEYVPNQAEAFEETHVGCDQL